MYTIILSESAYCPIPKISLSVIRTSATVYLLITHPAIYLFFISIFLPIHLHKPKHGSTKPPAYPSCAQSVTRLSSHCTVPYLPTPAPTCSSLDPPTQSKEPSIHPLIFTYVHYSLTRPPTESYQSPFNLPHGRNLSVSNEPAKTLEHGPEWQYYSMTSPRVPGTVMEPESDKGQGASLIKRKVARR